MKAAYRLPPPWPLQMCGTVGMLGCRLQVSLAGQPSQLGGAVFWGSSKPCASLAAGHCHRGRVPLQPRPPTTCPRPPVVQGEGQEAALRVVPPVLVPRHVLQAKASRGEEFRVVRNEARGNTPRTAHCTF